MHESTDFLPTMSRRMLDFNVRSFCHNSIMLINDAAVAAVEGVFLYTKGVSVPRM